MSEFEVMSDRNEALARGQDNPDRAWVLTGADVWHRNPYYQGPPVPHPEEDEPEEYGPWLPYNRPTDDEIPF